MVHQINPLNLGQKKWVEINNESSGNKQIKFKTTMLKSS